LSSLQAQLRRTPPKGTGTSPEGGLKRSAEDVGGTPKKVATTSVSGIPKPSPAKVHISKTPPSSNQGKTSGLSAKMPSSAPTGPPANPSERAAPQNSKPAPIVKKAAPLMPAVEKRPAVPPSVDFESNHAAESSPSPEDSSPALHQSSCNELIAAIESASTGSKLKHMTRLAEAIGETLQVEHINHFLRTLRKKVAERAQRDGAPVPSSASSAAKAAKSSKSAPPAAAKSGKPKQTVTPDATKHVEASKPGVTSAPMATAASTSTGVGMAPVPPSSPVASDDALLQLVGTLTEDPVCQDGVIREARLSEVLKRCWEGVAKKPKDWQAVWQAMVIPGDKQAEALQKFLNMTFVQTEDKDRAPLIIAELVKGHKVKLRSVEEVLIAFGHNLDGIIAMNEEAWHVYSLFFMHTYPKPQSSGWGWSRVGWSWQSWWQLVERTVTSLEPSRAVDVLGLMMKFIQDREGNPITEIWAEGDKMKKVLAKLSELGSCTEAEAGERLGMHGIFL